MNLFAENGKTNSDFVGFAAPVMILPFKLNILIEQHWRGGYYSDESGSHRNYRRGAGRSHPASSARVVKPINPAVKAHFHRDWCAELAPAAHAQRPLGPAGSWLRLACEAAESRLVRSFDDLQCLPHLPQLRTYAAIRLDTARRVLLRDAGPRHSGRRSRPWQNDRGRADFERIYGPRTWSAKC